MASEPMKHLAEWAKQVTEMSNNVLKLSEQKKVPAKDAIQVWWSCSIS